MKVSKPLLKKKKWRSAKDTLPFRSLRSDNRFFHEMGDVRLPGAVEPSLLKNGW